MAASRVEGQVQTRTPHCTPHRHLRLENLFLAFTIVDGCTEGKGREPLQWLFEQVAGKVASKFTTADIL